MNEKQAKLALGSMLKCVDDAFMVTSFSGELLAEGEFSEIADFADKVSCEEATGRTEGEKGVLLSVFNLLNVKKGGVQEKVYDAQIMRGMEACYPKEKGELSNELSQEELLGGLRDAIKKQELTEAYVNSVLGIMETHLSFVSAKGPKGEASDIALYDRLKLTAAISGCLLEYLEENDLSAKEYFGDTKQAMSEKAFLMMSMDTSGIQNFLYTVHSSGALKMLRAKSFYMEIMLEHIVDLILEKMSLSRANLIYSGGGHAYVLLPNTKAAKSAIEDLQREVNDWFIEEFGIDLFIAMAYTECSANDFLDMPKGCSSYRRIFEDLSVGLSEKKASRYSAEQIKRLNAVAKEPQERECSVCKRVGKLMPSKKDPETMLCPMCGSLSAFSDDVLDKKKSYVSVFRGASEASEGQNALMLPLGYRMVSDSEREWQEHKESQGYVRAYSKNDFLPGFRMATKIWVGNYSKPGKESFGKLAEAAGRGEEKRGIKRLGVLRGDVDDLGQAFISGFEGNGAGESYASLSRASAFSRKLSTFFKLNINDILEHPKYSIRAEAAGKEGRDAVIVYSGGDDIFLVGAWDDIIGAAVDLSDALSRYTQGKLTISAGLGLYPEKYPVKAFAREVGDLEDASKDMDGKNAITLFEAYDKKHSYHWSDFKGKVIAEKLSIFKDFLDFMPDKGMSAVYKLMEYVRGIDEKGGGGKINLARLAYMLGRMAPGKDAPEAQKERYKKFSSDIYDWVCSEKDRRELLTAIYLYVYLNRKQ